MEITKLIRSRFPSFDPIECHKKNYNSEKQKTEGIFFKLGIWQNSMEDSL
jgi:hypothetical protein